MPPTKTIQEEVAAIFATKWKVREGVVVPEADQVSLGNDAVELDATVLYADLVDSTDLVMNYKNWFAAEVYKAYLASACRLIRAEGGGISAFDGDRVMAVFLGNTKNSSAARAALKINWLVQKLINPRIKTAYPNTSYVLRHVIGIDTSRLFVARTGIRGSNDLVWVGRAANYAAKLCAMRDGAANTIISEQVFKRLTDTAKLGGSPKRAMWEKSVWAERGLTIYRSGWLWEP
jgi:Adenylate cyclase, family 3 (some proteins contain HAMP domain)